MAVMCTAAEAVPTTFDVGVDCDQYIGSVHKGHRGPQAFLNHLPPGFVIDPHFHVVDQFQIVVDGTSTVGGHVANPVNLHYADSSTAYGPIIAGEEGMKFFNFRARCDVSAEWMPASRDKMQHPRGREIIAQCRLGLTSVDSCMQVVPLIEPHDDGMAAYEIAAASGMELLSTEGTQNGRFQIVVDGSLVMDGHDLDKHSVAYVGPGERFPTRTAGPAGVHILELQFPHE